MIAVDRESGSINGFPEIVTRGFVADANGLIDGAQQVIVETLAAARQTLLGLWDGLERRLEERA